MSSRRLSTVISLMAMTTSTLAASSKAVKNGCYWDVEGLGSFNSHAEFTTSTSNGVMNDFSASTYTVAAGMSPLARRFDLANIGISSDKALTLTVPGGQSSGPISTAQITTGYKDILYGSVRTVAMVSNVPGTTHGFSFYANDHQEVDFAFLSSDTSVVHLTNEQVDYTAPFSSYTSAAPSDSTTAYHEYRVDWSPSSTKFYIDGVLIQTITDNVPNTPGFLLWNNWSNGNTWAQGPPIGDSVLKIQSIDAYFNRTSVSPSGSCLSTTSSSNAAAASASSKSPFPPAPTAANVQLCPQYNNTMYLASSGGAFQVTCGIDYIGGDFKMVYVQDLAGCMNACGQTAGCVDASLSGTACYMKNKYNGVIKNAGVNGARKI